VSRFSSTELLHHISAFSSECCTPISKGFCVASEQAFGEKWKHAH
jgi:hypothetical protein